MLKILLSLVLLTAASPVFSADAPGNVSYDQLLRSITTIPADIAAAPEAAKAAFEAEAEGRYWVTIAARDKFERTALLEAGFDIIEVSKDHVAGIAGPELLSMLSNKSFKVLSRQPLSAYAASYTKDFPVSDSIYHNYSETEQMLRQLASANSDIASLFSIGKTVEGRELWCLRINTTAKGNAASSKPGAFYLGNVHAREHLTTEVPLLFAAWLMDHRGDADIKKYIETLDIYIVPMGNPDGVEYDIKDGRYHYYRKNMAKNSNGSTGVDLNRNFGFMWCETGASTYPGSDTYCGPKAFSEPESVSLRDFMLAKTNIKTHITYHSYGAEILYPWGGTYDDIPNKKDLGVFKKMAAEMGDVTHYDPIKSSDLYTAGGDTADWAYDATGMFAFTFELEGRGFYPGAAIVKDCVERNVKAAVYMLSVTDDPYKVL